MNQYIIGPLTKQQGEIIVDKLKELGYKQHHGGNAGDRTAIKTTVSNKDSSPEVYNFGTFANYIHKKRKSDFARIPWETARIVSYSTFLSSHSQPKISVEADKDQPTISIDKERLVSAYADSPEFLQQFLVKLFGKDLFEEVVYKVGDKFQGKKGIYILTKINSNVVTLINKDTFENFGLSRTVHNTNHITLIELRALLGVSFNEFKKIN